MIRALVRKLCAPTLVAAAIVAGSVAGAGFAAAGAAAVGNPTCSAPGYYGEHCIWWAQNYTGAHWSDANNLDYNLLYYPTNGVGAGQVIGNNNGSDENRSSRACLTMYYAPNLLGYRLTLAKYASGGISRRAGAQLGTLLNNIRSDRLYVC